MTDGPRMSDSVSIRERLDAIQRCDVLPLGLVADLATSAQAMGHTLPELRLPITLISDDERAWLVAELSRALDRAEKAEAALRDVTAEEPETFAKLIADAMERWDLDDCDDRVYEDDWELSTWIAFDVARSLRSEFLAGGDS